MSVALSLVVVVFVVWFFRRLHWVWRLNQIPGLESSPFGLIGDIKFTRALFPDASFSPMQMFEPVARGFMMIAGETGLMRIWLGPIPHLLVTDADYAEAILSSNELIQKGFQYQFVQPWLGEGLIVSSGNKWRNRRKMLTPSFHFQILDQFMPIMNRNGRILVSKLEQMASKNNGLVRGIDHMLLSCTLDVICESIMGVRMNSQTNVESAYIRAVHEISEIMGNRSVKPWLFIDTIFNMTKDGLRQKELLKELHGFTDSTIKSRIQEITGITEAEARKREPFIDILIREHIQNPNEFTLLDIREEVDNFMFAGHDTTAWGVVWCTYLLGLNPECQQRLQEEVDAVYADKEEDEYLTMDELRTKLNYTEAAVKEAQRLYTSVPFMSRSVMQDTRIKEYDVPVGSQIMIIPSLVHLNPKYWSNPLKFKPERFLSRETQHPFAFIPFSAGPRNCIGQKFAMLEEKALIAHIFRKFNVKSLDPRDRITTISAAIQKSNIPLRLELKPRQHANVSQVTHL